MKFIAEIDIEAHGGTCWLYRVFTRHSETVASGLYFNTRDEAENAALAEVKRLFNPQKEHSPLLEQL